MRDRRARSIDEGGPGGIVEGRRAAGTVRLCQRMITVRQPALVFACTLGLIASAQGAYSPARYQAGGVPPLPAMTVGGGQVLLEVQVNREGRVTTVVPLQATPPFTDLLENAVQGWQFTPAGESVAPERPGARESRIVVASRVLVAAVYRPPAMNAPTLGERPREVAAPSDEIAFPLKVVVPPFPPSTAGSGVVLLEARVDRGGGVADATVLRSAPPFDDAALETLKAWRFRPAHVRGAAASTFVYVLFGFPVPVASAPRRAP